MKQRLTVGGEEVVGQSGVVPNGGDPKVGDAYPLGGHLHGGGACPLGGDPHVAVMASSLQSDLDTTVGADATSLYPKATRILPNAVAAT
jgi:hypothetical protein